VPGLDTGPCLRFPDQGRFHPLKYLNGLAAAIAGAAGACARARPSRTSRSRATRCWCAPRPAMSCGRGPARWPATRRSTTASPSTRSRRPTAATYRGARAARLGAGRAHLRHARPLPLRAPPGGGRGPGLAHRRG
jgi:type IV secretory pathway TrbL component